MHVAAHVAQQLQRLAIHCRCAAHVVTGTGVDAQASLSIRGERTLSTNGIQNGHSTAVFSKVCHLTESVICIMYAWLVSLITF